MNLNLVLQHVQVAAFEFFQVNCLDSYSFVGFANLDAFVDLAAEALAELILGVVLVTTHPDLRFIHRDAFLAC